MCCNIFKAEISCKAGGGIGRGFYPVKGKFEDLESQESDGGKMGYVRMTKIQTQMYNLLLFCTEFDF